MILMCSQDWESLKIFCLPGSYYRLLELGTFTIRNSSLICLSTKIYFHFDVLIMLIFIEYLGCSKSGDKLFAIVLGFFVCFNYWIVILSIIFLQRPRIF